MDADTLERTILDRIVPTTEEIGSMNERAERLVGIIRRYMSEHGIDVEVRLAGSFSKGTFLADPDLDVFMMFPESVPRSEMERVGLMAGEEILHGERMFSDHPYTRGVFEGMDVDMVPCYRLESTENLRSAVDRTPFHTHYIKTRLSEGQRDQVRLLKRFMKGIGTYGAEQDSRGFSGYLCELLVVRYGSFRGVLTGCLSWRSGTAIEIEGRGPKMDSALIVYDPVDPRRNVSSAVHVDTMARFMHAAAAYLDSPDERFFFPRERDPLDRDALEGICRTHGSRLISVSFPRPDVIEDSLYSQLWKTQYALCRKLDQHGFGVLRAVHGMDDSDMSVIVELERDTLPRTRRHPGPPVWVGTSSDFIGRWGDNPHGAPFIEDGRWTVIADRAHTRAEGMLESETAAAGIGRDLDPDSVLVLGHDATLDRMDPSLITELLSPRFPWEN